MAKGSDIIKIGFDYRASLEQFEKETNGAFDGISAKAGKQRISIQLDAKNDKVIEKIKELQKLKLDKFTFEFGESGLAEQLKTFDQLEKKIGEIIKLGEGKSLIDSSSTISDIGKITNAVNDLDKSINKSDTSALQQEEKQIKKNIDSIKKLLDLKYEVKNVNKSSYSGKGNYDWIGIYKNQEEAISEDLAKKKEKLHSSISLILSEDKNTLNDLEEEANRLKTALQSVQDLSNRISSNSSINYLDENKGSENWYKGYAEAYKAIDDRLGELHNQYRLTNEELEEYVTLQIKAEKIMDKMISHNGGVQGSGAKNKSELKSWIEKSFSRDLGLNPDDIYNGLFGNITDALYGSGMGVSLFGAEGTKRNLREISAEILEYKSTISAFDGAFGADQDAERLREINSILTYIKKNINEINVSDFSPQIKKATELVEYFSKKLEEGENTDYYSKALEESQKELQELIELQERLDIAKRQDTNVSQSSNVVEQLEKQEQQTLATVQAEEKLAETEKKLGNSTSTINDSKFDELKADVVEIREELNGLKEKISVIDSDGFENIKSDVEKTTESVKELNSELTELKSKVGDKSNISSEGNTPIIEDSKEVSKIDNVRKSVDGLLTDIKGLKHYTDEVFDSFNSNMFGSGIGENRLGNAAYFFDEKNMNDWQDIGEYSKYLTTWSANQVKLFNQTFGFTEEEIKRIIKEFYSGLDNDIQEDYKFDLKNIMDDDLYEFKSKFGIELQDVMKFLGYDAVKSNSGEYAFYNIDKLVREVQVYDNEANKIIEVNNKVAQSIKETSSTTIPVAPIKDVFQNEKVEQATTSAKELDKTLEQVNIPKDSFDDVLSKLDLTKSKLTEIVKITRQARADKDGKFYESFTLTDKNGSHETYGENSKTDRGQLLEAKYVEFDAKSADQETKTIKEAYEYNQKLDSVLSETKDKLNGLKFPSDISNEYKNLIDYSEELQHQLKNCEISVEQYSKKMDTAIQKFDKLSQSTFASKEQDSHNYWQGRFSDSIKDLSGENKNSALDDMRKYYQDLEKESAKVSEQEAKEIQKVWEDNLKVITDYMDAKTELNNLEASDKKSNKKSNEIADLTQEVEKAKVKAEEARIVLSSMVNPHDVDIDTWDKWIKTMEDFRQAGDGSSKSIAKLKDAIANVNTSELQTIDKYIESAQKKLDSTKSSRDDSEKSSSFKTYEKEVRKCIDALIAERNRLENAVKSGDIEIIDEGSLSNLNNLKQKLEETNSGFKTMFKGSAEVSRWKEIDTITKYMEKNTRISKEAKDKLREYIETLKTNGADANVEEIHKAFLRVCDGERKAKREGRNFLDVLRDKVWYQWAAQIGSYFSLNDILRYAKEGFETIKEYDAALTEMNKVSSESISILKDFQKESFDLADAVGTTASQIQNSTADFSRLGESFEQAKLSAQDANALFKVAEFSDISEATDALVAMSQAYNELEKSEINDVINYTGNNFSISTSELASALQRSAATLKVAGNDIYEATALVTAGNAVLQDAESVGTGLKMISLRILGTEEAKNELASLGENVDDFVVQTKSKLDETIRDYTAVSSNAFKGISVLDENGNYRSTYEILRDISLVYQEILETDKKAGTNRGQALLEVLAGKNRSNVAASILQNPELLTSVYEEAISKSQGSVEKELEAQLQSIESHINELSNAWDKLWVNDKNREVINFFLDLGTGILDVVDDVGVLNTAIMGIGAFAGFKNAG